MWDHQLLRSLTLSYCVAPVPLSSRSWPRARLPQASAGDTSCGSTSRAGDGSCSSLPAQWAWWRCLHPGLCCVSSSLLLRPLRPPKEDARIPAADSRSRAGGGAERGIVRQEAGSCSCHKRPAPNSTIVTGPGGGEAF